MTREELNDLVAVGKIKRSHTSYFRGYVRRTGDRPDPIAYKGKFGHGYIVLDPNWESSQYSYVTYYLYPEGCS